jgi:regulator of sigma D
MINFIDADYDLRTKVLLNNMLNDGYNKNVNVQVKNINKIENLCNAILDEYLEIQNIDDVITFYEKKLQQNKDHFCKSMLRYLLTSSHVDIIKKLINSFVKLKIFNSNSVQKLWTVLLEELDELLIDYPLTQINLPTCKLFIENFGNTSSQLKK